MRIMNPIMDDLLGENQIAGRHFALCESCFWSATILKNKERITCPICADAGTVSMIPLAMNESYRMNLPPKSGLEVSFSPK